MKFLKIVNLYLLFILNKGVMNDTDTQKGGKKPQNKRQLFNSTKGFFVVKKEEKEFEFEGHFLHAKKWILIITPTPWLTLLLVLGKSCGNQKLR